MDKGVYRIIDANLNRGLEGIRVCEDVIRFSTNNEALTAKLKELRHDVSNAINGLRSEHLRDLLLSRDSHFDVGKKSNDSEKKRKDVLDLFLANAQRGKESLRVLEEVLKLFDGDLAQKFKKFRFKLYTLEKTALKDIEDFKLDKGFSEEDAMLMRDLKLKNEDLFLDEDFDNDFDDDEEDDFY